MEESGGNDNKRKGMRAGHQLGLIEGECKYMIREDGDFNLRCKTGTSCILSHLTDQILPRFLSPTTHHT